MAEAYFVRRKSGTISGPFTLEVIKSAVKVKRLTVEDLISTSKDGPWKKLKLGAKNDPEDEDVEVAELAEPDNPNLTVCTDCGGTISKRAAKCPHCGLPQDPGFEHDDYSSDLPLSPYQRQRLKKAKAEADAEEPKKAKHARKNQNAAGGLVLRIFIWVLVGVTIPVVLGVTALAWKATNQLSNANGDRNLAQNNVAVPRKPVKRNINKDLFAKAYRAAIEYKPGDKRTLPTELKLIEFSVATDDEKEVFKLLKGWDELQAQQDKLYQYSKLDFSPALIKAAAASEQLKVTLRNPATPEIKQSLQLESVALEENYGLYTGVVAVMKKGGVIVEIQTNNKWFEAKQDLEKAGAAIGAKELSTQYKIPIQTFEPVPRHLIKFLPADELRNLLKIGADALSVAVGKLLNDKV